MKDNTREKAAKGCFLLLCMLGLFVLAGYGLYSLLAL